MKIFDSILVWFFLIAIVAVLVGSGQTDQLINSVSGMLSSLIGVITSPQTGTKAK
jgi:uncharacterized membrane protein